MSIIQKIILIIVTILFPWMMLFSYGAAKESLLNESSSVEKILEKYIQACGGSALNDIKTEFRKGTLIRGESGKVPFEIYSKTPGNWFYNQVFAYGEQVSYGYDGQNAWTQDSQGVTEMSAEQRLDLQLLLDVQTPFIIRQVFPEMAVKTHKKTGAKKHIILGATSPDGIYTELEFDQQTGLLVRAGDLYFDDYRDVGKVKRPFKIFIGDDRGEDHPRMKMEIADIVQDLEVNDAIFEQPPCALPVKKPPLYTLRNEVPVSLEALNRCVGVYQHPTDSTATYTVTTQQHHLMIQRTGWSGKIEIKPESELIYFVRFLNWEFRFITNDEGVVTHLEIDAKQKIKARKIN